MILKLGVEIDIIIIIKMIAKNMMIEMIKNEQGQDALKIIVSALKDSGDKSSDQVALNKLDMTETIAKLSDVNNGSGVGSIGVVDSAKVIEAESLKVIANVTVKDMNVDSATKIDNGEAASDNKIPEMTVGVVKGDIAITAAGENIQSKEMQKLVEKTAGKNGMSPDSAVKTGEKYSY